MDTKRLVIGTIVGGVTLYVTGYLIFQVAVADFYSTQLLSAASAFRDANLQWALALGNLSLAALVTLGVTSKAGPPMIGRGFITGAVIGFLAWLGVDFIYYSYTNLWNFPALIVDALLELVHLGIAGAVIAAVLARIPKGAGSLASRVQILPP